MHWPGPPFYPSFVKDVLKLIREERVKANNSPNFPVGIKVKLKETIFKMSYPFEDDDDERLVDGICTFSLDWSGRTEARRAHFNRWLEYEKTTEPYSPSPSPSPSTPSSPSSRIGQPSLPFTEEDVQSHPYAKPTFDLRQLLIQGTSFVYIGTSIPSNQQDDILKLIASCFNSLDHHQNLPDLKDGVVRWGSRGFGEGAWKYVVSTLFDVKKGEDGRTTKRKRVETVGSSESGWSLTEKYKNAKPFPDYSITSSDEFLNNPVVNIINSYNGTDGIVKMIDRFGKFNDDSEGFTREMHRLVDKIAEVGCSNHNGKGLYNCVFSHANPDYKTYGVPEMAYESPYGEQDSIVVGLDDDNEEVMGTAIFCQGCATGVNIVFDIGKTLLECVAIRSRPGHGSSQTLPRVLGMFSHCGSCSIQRVGNGNSVEDFERVLPFRCNPCGSNKNQKKFLQVLASNAEALLERPDIPVEELTSIQTFIGGSCIQECQTSDCHGVVFRDGRFVSRAFPASFLTSC
ncbi:hypothetical protein BDY24DRAFT_196095 [Mrakia frigida]|uniref:uncharacterized protein n=1 Tax=Mrakia frigida TaxID=29902 RepID=UPI003FCC250D